MLATTLLLNTKNEAHILEQHWSLCFREALLKKNVINTDIVQRGGGAQRPAKFFGVCFHKILHILPKGHSGSPRSCSGSPRGLSLVIQGLSLVTQGSSCELNEVKKPFKKRYPGVSKFGHCPNL